jgi:hypothetical protein
VEPGERYLTWYHRFPSWLFAKWVQVISSPAETNATFWQLTLKHFLMKAPFVAVVVAAAASTLRACCGVCSAAAGVGATVAATTAIAPRVMLIPLPVVARCVASLPSSARLRRCLAGSRFALRILIALLVLHFLDGMGGRRVVEECRATGPTVTAGREACH